MICLSACGCAKLNCFIKNLPYWSDTLLLFCPFCPIFFPLTQSLIRSLNHRTGQWVVVVGQRNTENLFDLFIWWCYDWPDDLQYFCCYPGRLRTKQTLSTASSMGSSQVDSRGRTKSKITSQSQRKYLQFSYNIHTHSTSAVNKHKYSRWTLLCVVILLTHLTSP